VTAGRRDFQPTAQSGMTLPERIAWAGFFVTIALAFSLSVESQFTLPKLLWLRATASMLVLLWALRWWRGGVRPIPAGVLSAAGALAAWWIVTTVFAVDRATALHGMYGRYNGLLNHLVLVSICLVLASTPMSQRDVEGVARWFAVALIPVALYAVAQEAGLDPIVWPNARPGSTIGHPVPLAASLSLAVPFLLALAVRETHRPRRWMWLGVLVVFLYVIAATLSRGPWIGLAVSAAVMATIAFRHGLVTFERPRITITGIAAIAIAVTVAVASGSAGRIASRLEALTHLRSDPSFMDRLVYFDAAGRMLRDHPLAGVGFESFALLYPRYRPVEGESVPADSLPTMVHNGYLQMAVTNGVPALALYLILMTAIGLRLWRTCRRPVADRSGPAARTVIFGAALMAALAGYLVQDLSGWLEVSLSAFFWAVLGAAVSFTAAEASEPRRMPAARWRLAGSLTAVCGAIAIASLAVGTLRELRADSHFFEAQHRDVSKDWPSIEQHVATGLALVPDEPHYEDLAGIVYLKRMKAVGRRDVYDRSSALLDHAAQGNRFDPYILIHRVDLETAALQQQIVASTSDTARRAADRVTEMDPNNATVHEAVARLQLAERRPEAALSSIRLAEALRPHHARYHLIAGDALRQQGDPAAAVASYRAETMLAESDQEWAIAQQRLILALLETGQAQPAADEARAAVARLPADAVARALLGFAYLRLTRVDAAKAAFAAALAIDPTNAQARAGLRDLERINPGLGR
jgi:O-antigen ligase/tetratricopeptide (TPR) repeat protein